MPLTPSQEREKLAIEKQRAEREERLAKQTDSNPTAKPNKSAEDLVLYSAAEQYATDDPNKTLAELQLSPGPTRTRALLQAAQSEASARVDRNTERLIDVFAKVAPREIQNEILIEDGV